MSEIVITLFGVAGLVVLLGLAVWNLRAWDPDRHEAYHRGFQDGWEEGTAAAYEDRQPQERD